MKEKCNGYGTGCYDCFYAPEECPDRGLPHGSPLIVKWTIQVNYSARNDDGKKFRARSVFHTEAGTLPEAYAKANVMKEYYEDVSFGACVHGHSSSVGRERS